MSESLVFFVIMTLCAALFIGLGAWAWKRSDPTHFWSGSTVSPNEIRDVEGYNRANGIMWIVYGVCFLALGALAFWDVAVAGIATAVGCVGGLPALVLVYYCIYNKYKA